MKWPSVPHPENDCMPGLALKVWMYLQNAKWRLMYSMACTQTTVHSNNNKHIIRNLEKFKQLHAPFIGAHITTHTHTKINDPTHPSPRLISASLMAHNTSDWQHHISTTPSYFSVTSTLFHTCDNSLACMKGRAQCETPFHPFHG